MVGSGRLRPGWSRVWYKVRETVSADLPARPRDEEDLQAMLVDTPRRLLAFAPARD